jgi:predicted RNA-binding protein
VHLRELRFRDIRQDWYYSNQLLPRLLRNSINRADHVRFVGFPRQWIPILEYYGIRWRRCSEPAEHIPIVSEISDHQLARFSRAAQKAGTLRCLVESITALDPLLADLLYIVDHSADLPQAPIPRNAQDGKRLIRLSSWQAYGRPEILQFEAAVDQVWKSKPVAVLLPCSRGRPYRSSRIHRKIWKALSKLGYEPEEVDQLVVTSLGVVPEPLWEHPVVMGYDAGVPDIYRVLRLARRFLARNPYTRVVDCLQFAPYSDIFKILQHEKIVKHLCPGPVSRSRHFYLKT